LFHVFGMTVAMNWALASGAAMVLLPNPRDSAQLVASVARHRVTIFPGVPAMFNALNHHPGIEDVDVSSVKACFSGSAPLPADVLERFERLTGARILEGYGLTETSPVTHVNPMRGTRKIGTIGMPVSDTDARVVDAEDGRTEVPSGTEGELLLRGPQVMAGYWQRPDETAKTLVDGWLATGDLVTVDADGYFRIVGRKKDMINASGLKVYPDEVDAVLVAHPDVLEAATIGVPHPERGETVKSFVVLRAGKSLTVDALQAWCRESLAPYKVPREVEFLDALPKSTVLKVLRRELREREARRGAAPSPP
jgi:long-chain acyl-CoA synthetase